MAFFPVSNSNLSASHLGDFISKKYAVGDVTGCSLIRSGINDTYMVSTSQKRFVFRVYSLNWRTEKEIAEELRLLDLLKEKEISISYPIADKEKAYIHVLSAPEGNRYGVLFSFAEGEKLHSFTTDVHYAIGRMMAEFHLVTDGLSVDRTTYTPQLLVKDPLHPISRFLSDTSEEMKFMKMAQGFLWDELERANLGSLRKGVVHLDIWYENLNVDTNNQVTLFDFDFCGNGWLCLDIAFYMLQVYSIERDEKERDRKMAAFFEGYESVTKIPEEERKLLPVLGVSLYFFYLGIQCQRYDNWSNHFLSESYLKRYIHQLVKRYFDIHQLGKNK